MNTTMTSFVRRHQIVVFYVLAYALTWLVWGTAVAQQYRLIAFHIPAWFGYWGVTIAAFLVAGIVDGRAGVRDLLHRMIRWRVGVRWYVAALLLQVALPLVAVGISALIGGPVPFGAMLSLGAAVTYFVTNTPFMLLTEETAWRGFAQTRLQRGRSALTAAIIAGLLWSPWHIPLFMTGHLTFPFLPFVVSAVAMSILTAWLYNSSGGSVLIAALFHCATDAAWSYTGVLSGGSMLLWLVTGLTWLAAIVVILIAGPAHLARTRHDEQTTAVPAPSLA